MEQNLQVSKVETFDSKAIGEYLDAMGLATMLTPKEKTQFVEISKAFGLNPFKREIYCVKYKADSPLSIIVGYETYIKRAERSGMLDGWQVVTEGKPDDDSLKAIITIYRKDRKHPFIHEVYYSEYVQKKDGRPNKFWEKAQTMTKKVAIAQGFRLCFSDELGGMPYTSDEITDGDPNTISIEPLIETKPILDKSHKDWNKIVKAIKEGKRTIEQAKEKFDISEEIQELLISELNNLL